MSRRATVGARVAMAAGLLALAACGSSSKTSSTRDAQVASVDAEGKATSGLAAPAAAGSATTAASSTATTVPAGSPTTDAVAVDRKVIVTVTLDLLVDDVGASGVKVATMAEGAGGYVFSQQTNLGEHPSSSIVLKVPPDKVAGLLTTLGNVGRLQSQTQQAEDVTAQFVDLQARITTAQASVARVRDFLDKTTNVSELANLEGELTRRQTELEQLLGQQRVLAARTDLATVTVTLTPTAARTPTARPGVGSALRAGGRSLAAIGLALAMVGAFLLPWLPVVVVLVAVGLWLRRRHRRALSAAPPAPGNGHRGGPPPFPAGPAAPAAPTPGSEREKVDA